MNRHGSNDISIIVPSPETESDGKLTTCMTVAGTALYPSDIGILEGSRKWLNERLINVGQAMIKAKFPHMAGLQDVGRSDTVADLGGVQRFPWNPPFWLSPK